jgi:phage terminase large subunit
LLITKRSINLIEELQKYTWKKNRDGGYETTPVDNYNHGLDALRYIAMMRLGQRKEGSVKPVMRFM